MSGADESRVVLEDRKCTCFASQDTAPMRRPQSMTLASVIRVVTPRPVQGRGRPAVADVRDVVWAPARDTRSIGRIWLVGSCA